MDEPKFDLFQLFDQKNNLIKDERVFEPNFIPECLVHREKELEQLAAHFKSILSDNSSTHGKQILIQGSVGLGKTAVVRKFGETIEKYCEDRSHSIKANIFYYHANCRRQRSWYLIFTSILRRLVPAFPVRGFSTDELLNYLIKILEERRQSILLCLDEIDYLVSNSDKQNILYSLIRYHEGSSRNSYSHISLIMVTRNRIFHNLLDKAIRSSLSQNTIFFAPYDEEQLFDILMNRAKKGLFKKTFSIQIIKIVASLAYEHGDARYAIELLWRSAKIAEQEKVRNIEIEHVRKAQVSVFPIKQSMITELSPQMKYILRALAILLKNEKTQAFVTTTEVREKYEEICLQSKMKPRKQTQFWYYLQQLSKYGLISLKVHNRHQNGKSEGRVTSIGISNVPISDLLLLLE
ncbi:MAG: Cdc6/Cdc18 family protein [Candidatus Hodarchaeales archaeon]